VTRRRSGLGNRDRKQETAFLGMVVGAAVKEELADIEDLGT